jgi:hypothetical protein
MWQEINEPWLSCQWWQDRDERRIPAMTSILILLAMVALAAALVRYARHDRFAGPTVRFCPRDDLGCAAHARLVS